VLLVDDVADSGRTLALAVELLREKGADVRSVTIYTKPTTIIQPDYAWKDTDRWIDFPWSAKGTVREEDLGLPPTA
jgi:hypoxanthine phosphoribosyltransferase